MKLKKLVTPMLTALAWFSINSVQAVTPNPILQFTELSDTELKVTLSGADFGTVVNLGTDRWEWHSGIFLDGQQLTSDIAPFGQAQWLEPENDSLVNLVTFGFFPSLVPEDLKTAQLGPEVGAVILSDVLKLPGLPAYENGQPGGDVFLGTLTVTPIFLDTGDEPARAPDAGATCVLLLSASAGLLGLNKLRFAKA